MCLFTSPIIIKTMGYRWKPNASQRAAYREKMEELSTLNTVRPSGAIRTGCYVVYYSTNKGETIRGTVIKHSYGSDKGQHTFTIDNGEGKILVKGRNLYPNLLKHIQGQESKEADER